ncbi:MAG: hypothetical protein V4819_15160 [Verrucomicrobiota bacterium]
MAPSIDHFELGSAFSSAGDVNGDGVIDVAVADRSGKVDSKFASGIVHLVNGTNGLLIRSYTGVPAPSQNFGFSLVALNADGDGIPDLAVGSPGQKDASGVHGAGAVRIYAGSNGSLLATIVGPSESQLGSSLANAGDQDGDGRDDLYSGAPFANGAQGAVMVISSGSASILETISTPNPVSAFGSTVVCVGDLDGDGLADVAIGAPGFRLPNGNPVGQVVLVRSSDSSIVATTTGAGNSTRLGDSLASAADANNDGRADLLVGSSSGGTALIVSGADLTTITDLSIPLPRAGRRLVVGGSLDFNNDGVADWLIGSNALVRNAATLALLGGIRVVSGTDHATLFELIATAPNTDLGSSVKVLPGLGMAAGEQSLVDPISHGTGLARVWKVVEIRDADGDGINDDVDLVENSIMDPTVAILGADSGVPNRLDDQGMTLADRFAELGPKSDYSNPAQYFVTIKQLCEKMVADGLLNPAESKLISKAAQQSVNNSKANR